MTTPESHIQPQLLLISAYTTLVSAIIIVFLALFFFLPGHLFKPLLLLSASLFSLSAGEFLNHPKQRVITQETVKANQEAQYHRKRSPCALGNLFDICGLLLLFVALSAFFFPH